MRNCHTIECDVLVVGGGGAATRAAIEADSLGARVVLVSKGPVGRSGATPLAFTSYQAAFGYSDPRDNPQIHFEDTVREGRYLGDENLVQSLVLEATERAIDLQRYGVKFKEENGRLYQASHPGESYPRNLIIEGGGYAMAMGLRRELTRRHRRVRVIEDSILTKLLCVNGEIAGAVALDLRDGECVAFRTGCVVMATGGYHHLWKRNDVSSDLAGDGIALAYKAGAELVDMEMALFYPTLYFYSEHDQGLVVVYEWFLEKRYLAAGLVNALGQDILPAGKLPLRDELSRIIFNEIEAGRATERGTVFIDINRSPKSYSEREQVFRELVGGPGKNLLSLGVDVTRDRIEVGPGIHYTLGGIRINEKGETSIPGLYSAGEASGNVHGANRVSGNALAATQVFGARAGQSAAIRSRGVPLPELPRDLLEREVDRIYKLRRRRKGGVRPIEVKRELQAVMDAFVGPTRNEKALETAVHKIGALREGAESRLEVVDIPVFNNEWREALEVVQMLDLAEVVSHCAVMRKESRGHHRRSDFPLSDDSWLRHTIATFREGKVSCSTAPVVRLTQPLEV
jgi:succinate dehydrogenase/fumarate reductase flavoprotein subunit